MQTHRIRLLKTALLITIAMASARALAFAESQPETPVPRKVVLIAGPKSHGPVGNGLHDYPWSVKLLKVMLDNSNIRDHVRVEYHLDGFPADPRTLDDADTIMVISDGRDGDKFVEAPHFQSEANLKAVQKQIDRRLHPTSTRNRFASGAAAISTGKPMANVSGTRPSRRRIRMSFPPLRNTPC